MNEAKNPYQRGIIALWFMLILLTLPILASAFMVLFKGWDFYTIPLSAILWIIFAMAQLAAIISGRMQASKANEFLNSSRHLVRWTYTPMEWNMILKEKWDEEKDDWKLQLFGMTFIFALVGVVVGILGMIDDTINPIVSTAAGTFVGLVLGAVIALGNHLGALWEYKNSNPQVAIGVNEIFQNNQYFKADKRNWIKKVSMQKENPPKLVFEIHANPLLSKPAEEEWFINIPENLAEEVEKTIPRIQTKKQEDEEEWEEENEELEQQ